MSGYRLPVVISAIVVGVSIAFIMAVLYLGSINVLWSNIQNSFGHSMFHHLEKIVMGAVYAQAYSLLIVLSLLAGALTVYLSRAHIGDNKSALLAGAFTGVVIASIFSLAAISFAFTMTPGGMASDSVQLYLQYLVTNLLQVLFISLVVPGLFTLPGAAIGGLAGRRSMIGAEDRPTNYLRPAFWILLSTIAGLLIAALMSTLIAQAYNLPPGYPFLFSLPLIVTLPMLAAVVARPLKIRSVPALFLILGLSILAIILIPMISVILACQTGIIYAPPYEWEQFVH